MSRLYCPLSLTTGQTFDLPPTAARHAQVLRLQPGASLSLFDGLGGAWQAEITGMGRQSVQALVLSERELSAPPTRCVTLAVGMPANERMDWLVEKATELGVARITPLMTARGVLRFTAERAHKRQLHWQGIAQAACAQSGRNQVPVIDVPQSWSDWWSALTTESSHHRWLLSLSEHASSLPVAQATERVMLLSGPEGGLSQEEETQAVAKGFARVTLGPRILRAETAPLAVLSQWL